jgi:hypothetical protein
VSATQLLAQSIASLALPRKVNDTFLYGNSALGEAQKFAKPVEPIATAVNINKLIDNITAKKERKKKAEPIVLNETKPPPVVLNETKPPPVVSRERSLSRPAMAAIAREASTRPTVRSGNVVSFAEPAAPVVSSPVITQQVAAPAPAPVEKAVAQIKRARGRPSNASRIPAPSERQESIKRYLSFPRK